MVGLGVSLTRMSRMSLMMMRASSPSRRMAPTMATATIHPVLEAGQPGVCVYGEACIFASPLTCTPTNEQRNRQTDRQTDTDGQREGRRIETYKTKKKTYLSPPPLGLVHQDYQEPRETHLYSLGCQEMCTSLRR